MSRWSEYDWSDVTPDVVPEIPGHVAQIAYSDKFKEVMSLFRAVAANNEVSPRVLALTREIIELNPAHYSIWDYRIKVVKEIGNSVFDFKQVGLTPKAETAPPIGEDGEWLNQFTLSHAKNYQVWNYRQHLIDPSNPLWFRGEKLLAMMVFEDDSKNFHAWSHLKNIVLKSTKCCGDAFGDGSSLLADCDGMLQDDVLNNSVWSFRYFVYTEFPNLLDASAELEFVKRSAAEAPANESVWAYLRGFISDLCPAGLDAAKQIASQYPDEPRAIELLAELSDESEAKPLWTKLCDIEPMRAPFWEARMVSTV